jgi:hypothetical protein
MPCNSRRICDYRIKRGSSDRGLERTFYFGYRLHLSAPLAPSRRSAAEYRPRSAQLNSVFGIAPHVRIWCTTRAQYRPDSHGAGVNQSYRQRINRCELQKESPARREPGSKSIGRSGQGDIAPGESQQISMCPPRICTVAVSAYRHAQIWRSFPAPITWFLGPPVGLDGCGVPQVSPCFVAAVSSGFYGL